VDHWTTLSGEGFGATNLLKVGRAWTRAFTE
jgi:hypothetical protein